MHKSPVLPRLIVMQDTDAKPLTLRQRRHAQTRADLVTAALEIIRAGGVGEASVDRITQVAGISRGTFYAHFAAGRDDLLRAAYASLGEDLVERSRAGVSAARDWRAGTKAVAVAMFDLASDAELGHFYNVSGPALIPSGEGRGIGSSASVELLVELLESGRAAGELAEDVDVRATAVLLVGALRESATAIARGSLTKTSATRAFARLVAGLAA